MRRFTVILAFLALSTYVACSIVNTKDVPMKDAELENGAAVPELEVAPVDEVAQPNSVTETPKCAKVGEFCISHKDCCSNACLGYMRRCVSGREYLEED